VERGVHCCAGETAERELSGFRIQLLQQVSGQVEMGMLGCPDQGHLPPGRPPSPARSDARMKIRAHGPEVAHVDISLGLPTIQLPRSALGAGQAGDFRWHGLRGNRDPPAAWVSARK